MTSLSLNQITIVGIVAVGIVTFAFLGLKTFNRFVDHLKSSHPQIWKSIERRDSLATPRDNKWAVFSFVLSRGYREANDPELTKMGDSLFVSAFVIATDIGLIAAILGLGLFH